MHTEIEDTHDMSMFQVRDGPRFSEEILLVLPAQVRVQDFDRRARLEVDVLTQIHFSEAAPTQEMDEAIVSKVLSYTLLHRHFSRRAFLALDNMSTSLSTL